jgi:pilus assembly protein CpaC
MQINIQITPGKKVFRRNRGKVLVMVAGAALTVLAVVRGTTAQTATTDGSAAPATQPVASSGNSNDLIAGGIGADGKLNLAVNKTAVITTKVPYHRVVVGQPDVVRDNEIGPNSILLTALKPGTTQIIVWDDANRSQAVDVVVGFDLAQLEDQYKTMFPDATIKVTVLNGVISLTGRTPNLRTADQAATMAGAFGKVNNFLEVSGGQQVALHVRFAEVSKTADSELGINFGGTDGKSFFANNAGQVNPFGLIAGAAGGNALGVPSPSSVITLFGEGHVGNTTFDYFVDALRSNDLLRVLAEPDVMAISGEQASFLAGGEFPIPVTQGGGTGAGGTAVTVEYREFGVKLNMTPVVLGNGRIRLKVAPEVSDLDFTTAVKFNGFVIPGLTSRKVETTVELNEGDTFSIAGLLSNNITSNKDVTPVLGDIPVLGALFRSVRYERKETELVVLVTPHLVSGMSPDQVPSLPGEKWRDPTEAQLFMYGDIGNSTEEMSNPTTRPSAKYTPPAFQGTYGFAYQAPEVQTSSTSDDESE